MGADIAEDVQRPPVMHTDADGPRIVPAHAQAGATGDAGRGRRDDGLNTSTDGVISDADEPALAAGVRMGMPAAEATLLLRRARSGA